MNTTELVLTIIFLLPIAIIAYQKVFRDLNIKMGRRKLQNAVNDIVDGKGESEDENDEGIYSIVLDPHVLGVAFRKLYFVLNGKIIDEFTIPALQQKMIGKKFEIERLTKLGKEVKYHFLITDGVSYIFCYNSWGELFFSTYFVSE